MGAAIAAKLRGEGHDLPSGTGRPAATTSSWPPVRGGPKRRPTRFGAPRSSSRCTDPPALEQVLFGDEGAASAIGRDATLIEMSTLGPSAIASVVERLAPADVIDAPVLGSVPSVETAGLVILAGGDREVFDRHAGCSRSWERDHVGPPARVRG